MCKVRQPKPIRLDFCSIPRRLFLKDHEGGESSRGTWNTGAAQSGARICRESLFTVSCRSDRNRAATGITKII
nr:MAG TPA: hypothetical protein [Caudoviricetes sp.]DAM33775.1 MAG TPA: hypothetical protein [Caudoviricetes sp.]